MTAEITQIKIGKHRIGIIGFKTVCRHLADQSGEMTDDEIKDTFMSELKKSNYIPENALEEYEQAFFKAYKAFAGEPVTEISEKIGIEIKVLGQGCVRCNQLEKDVMDVVSEMNLEADIEHVRELMEIAAYGILALPALVINGQIKSAGIIPPKTKIMAWIQSAHSNMSK